MTAGGPLNRRRSLSRDARQSAGPYARRASSSASVDARSAGSRASFANPNLSFDDVDVPPEEGALGAARRAIGAALSFRPSKAVALAPIELSIWKPNAEDALGITFEADSSFDGVVVATIQPGQLMAKAKKLKEGDVVHVINGRTVATPHEVADILSAAKGIIQLVITRSARQYASLGPAEDAEGGDGEELTRADRARSSLLPIAIPAAVTGGRRSKNNEPAETAGTAAGGSSSAAGGGGEDGSATVVVSCSQLILESKRIMGSASGLDSTLDELYAALKAKTVRSQAALARLVELVGQTTVEQAGLVIANAAKGHLADGWVEYYDRDSAQHYYYNVHTKATTWTKPLRPRATPQRRKSLRGSVSGGGERSRGSLSGARPDDAADAARSKSSHVRHELGDAIAARATRQKMLEEVHLECVLSPKHGYRGHWGLQSVSL